MSKKPATPEDLLHKIIESPVRDSLSGLAAERPCTDTDLTTHIAMGASITYGHAVDEGLTFWAAVTDEHVVVWVREGERWIVAGGVVPTERGEQAIESLNARQVHALIGFLDHVHRAHAIRPGSGPEAGQRRLAERVRGTTPGGLRRGRRPN